MYIQISYDIYINCNESNIVEELWLAHTEFPGDFLNKFKGSTFSQQLLNDIRDQIKRDQLKKHEAGIITLEPLSSSREDERPSNKEKNWITLHVDYQIRKGLVEWVLPKIGLLGNVLGSVFGIVFDAIAMMLTENNRDGEGLGITGAVAGGLILMFTFRFTRASEKLRVVGRKVDNFISWGLKGVWKKIEQACCRTPAIENDTNDVVVKPKSSSTRNILLQLGVRSTSAIALTGIAFFDAFITGNGVYQEIDLVTSKFVSQHNFDNVITPEIVQDISATMYAIAFTATFTFDISIVMVLYQLIVNALNNRLQENIENTADVQKSLLNSGEEETNENEIISPINA